MQVTIDRTLATAWVLPRAVQLTPALVCAGTGLAVVTLVSRSPNAAWHGRLAGVVVAVACAGLLDDTAAPTLAPSPTSLAIRRAIRVAVVGAGLGLWWSAMLVAMSVRTEELPILVVTRELAVLVTFAMIGGLVVQRHNRDGRGAAGGILALGWFVLSFLPRIGRIPLPPNALDPDAAGALTVILVCEVAALALLSRDPASKRLPARVVPELS